MRFLKTFCAISISAGLVIAPVHAAALNSSGAVVEIQQNNRTEFGQKDGSLEKGKDFCRGERKDPVKFLEQRKEEVKSLLKEGKITKQQADEKISGIDAKIKEIEAFNKLSLKEKRSVLTEKFKQHLEKKVKEGRITQEKADEIQKEFTRRLNEWDGKGYPGFYGKGMKHHKTQDK